MLYNGSENCPCLLSILLFRSKNVILLRPPSFLDHDAHFIMALGKDGGMQQKTDIIRGTAVKYTCWAVPHHLRQRPWPTLLGSPDVTDQLVLTDSPMVSVLSKFEDPQFIHTYITSAGKLKFELPRYQLMFAFEAGRLLSENYRGYQLASNQQLASTQHYTMPNIRQYLVLEKSAMAQQDATTNMGQRRENTMVLIPVGDVTVERPVFSERSDLVHVAVSRWVPAQLLSMGAQVRAVSCLLVPATAALQSKYITLTMCLWSAGNAVHLSRYAGYEQPYIAYGCQQ
jgi:hypothetical protein